MPKFKFKIALVLLTLFGVATVASAAANLKVSYNGFAVSSKTGKYQVGNKMVPAVIQQNGANYIVADMIAQLIKGKYSYNAKTNTHEFVTDKVAENKEIQDLKAQVRQLQAQNTQLNNQVRKLQTARNQEEGWLEYETKHYTLFYKKKYEQDLKQVQKIFDRAYETAVQSFKSILPRTDTILNNEFYPIRIYLHDSATDRVSEGSVYNLGFGTGDALTSEIHVLTPSAYNIECCTIEGWKYDDTYMLHVYTHEYLHSPQHIVQERYRYVAGWFPENQPQWLVEGLAEYLAYRGSDAYQAKLDYWKPKAIESPQDHVTIHADSISVQTPYVGGFLFTAFLYEQYGESKYHAFLLSGKLSMEDAFKETYGSFSKVKSDWLQWLKK